VLVVVLFLSMRQAIAAVVQHKTAEACSRARDEAAVAAAAAAKQQLQSTHQEAEQKAAKLLAEANGKVSGLLTPSQQMLMNLQMQQSHTTAQTAKRMRALAGSRSPAACRTVGSSAQWSACAAPAVVQAASAAVQHSQELASLQAQLATLQGEKRQLFGKSAQQSRNARQAQAAADELQGQVEQLRQQLLRQNKQLEAKEAALAR
jgi:hypothetical protein